MIFKLNLKFFRALDETKEIFNKISLENLTVSTDTREIQPGYFFMAIGGDTFDGHDYLSSAIDKGAVGLIVDSRSMHKIPKEFSKPVIAVENTVTFMQTLAVLKLKAWKEKGGKVFSLTGSNGKTTNKEILFRILEGLFPNNVYSTKGNFNNHIGVPLTIFEIQDSHEYAIIEVGTNHPGEIPALCEIAMPDFGYITNIGDSHLEFFKNRIGVLNEKRALYDYVLKHSKESKCFLKNNYDELLKNLESTSAVRDIGLNCDYQVEVRDGKLRIQIENDFNEIFNPNITEDFNLFNLGMCVQFANMVFPELRKKIIEIANEVELPKNNRSVWITKKNKHVFLDAYNANPSSMQASLSSFINKLKLEKVEFDRALFVIGDMNELGDNVANMHQKLAQYLSEAGVSNVAFVGRYREYYQSGFNNKDLGDKDVVSFLNQWPELFQKFEYFFIKGSRSVQLERLVESI